MGSSAGSAPRLVAVRRGAAYLLGAVVGIVLVSSVYLLVGFVYFRLTGRLVGGLTANDISGEQVGAALLGAAIVIVGLGAAAVFVLPNRPRQEVGEDNTEQTEPGRRGPPAERPRVKRDEEMLDGLRSDPQLATVEYLLERLLLESENRERARSAQAERRGRRRDLLLLVAGTVLGVVAPVICAPLLRQLSFG